MARILTFSGSTRADSNNQKTVDTMSVALHDAGAEVTGVSLRDYAAPIYDGDTETESGLPESISKFRTLLSEHDGFVIGCPEYNGFMTPLLMNTIDWATRSPQASADLAPFRGKSVLVVSASPGGMGGARAATHLKTMLSGIGCIISPENFTVSASFKAFDADGRLVDPALQDRANQIANRFNDFAERLRH